VRSEYPRRRWSSAPAVSGVPEQRCDRRGCWNGGRVAPRYPFPFRVGCDRRNGMGTSRGKSEAMGIEEGCLRMDGHVRGKPCTCTTNPPMSWCPSLPRIPSRTACSRPWPAGFPRSWRYPPIREWVEDGVNGFLVPCRDAATLAEKVAMVWGDTEGVEAWTGRARTIIRENCDGDVAAKNIKHLVETVARVSEEIFKCVLLLWLAPERRTLVVPEVLPLVTVVTPVYNREDYLEEVILSVLGQDYPNIEFIVLDDGSTDGTLQVIWKYRERLRWESHANMGQTRTVNKGFSMAKGEIVGVVNSDDPLLPGAIREIVAFMRKGRTHWSSIRLESNRPARRDHRAY